MGYHSRCNESSEHSPGKQCVHCARSGFEATWERISAKSGCRSRCIRRQTNCICTREITESNEGDAGKHEKRRDERGEQEEGENKQENSGREEQKVLQSQVGGEEERACRKEKEEEQIAEEDGRNKEATNETQ